jgi:hypothetical protein
VRSHQLEAAVTEFMEDAARRLQTDVACGAEVGFEVERRGRSAARTPLYCYRPLTSEFMGERWRALCGTESFRGAVGALERFEGLERYIGGPGERAGGGPARSGPELALWMLLGDVFAEQTEFELRAERLEGALERLYGCAGTGADKTTLVATLHGMVISSDELPLSSTLRIARPGALVDMPEEVVPVGPTDEPDHLLLVHTTSDDAEQAGEQGAAAFRDALCALRLFGDGRVALGGLAWARGGAGRWRPLPLRVGGRPHGMLVVADDQEDELRAFCNLISRRTPADNELAWALRRFQMGCERELECEALSDYLLALRALLEPEGSPRGVLAGRLAALCALPDERPELAALVVRAIEFERDVIRGRAVENASSERLVRTIGDHLRALLRDVICGHLEADLASLADELLLEATPGTTGEQSRRAAQESDVDLWEEPDEAWQEERSRQGAPQAPPATRAPIRLGREPMPVADELDDDQLRLIGMPG